VFFGCSDGNLYALDRADGKPLWKFEAASPMTASPAVAARRLVIGTLDGLLYCFGSDPGAAGTTTTTAPAD
jgi:outer membrane protein assembly factor BamB